MKLRVEIDGKTEGHINIPWTTILMAIIELVLFLISFIGNAILITYGPFIGTIMLLVAIPAKSPFWVAIGATIIISSFVKRRKIKR